nr:heavy metal-associated isoprenylated plant protein 47-like [Ipomoea batatas]
MSAGVSSVNIDEAKNQLVVIGVGVDSFELIKCLKKKFKCASIVSIEEVKPPPPAQPKDGPCPPPNPCVQYYPVCQPFYDPYPQSSCSIQ